MPWDQSSITGVSTPVARAGVLYLQWTSTAPAGTWFQVYVAGGLAWSGTARSASIAWGHAGRARIDVGAVLASEAYADLSASLASPVLDRAVLRWQGGTFEDPDVAGFRVYGGTTPGGSVSYAGPLATVAAYEHGLYTDGFGMGGFGSGGFGYAAGDYSWTSGPLAAGVWSFAIRPYNLAGNEGTAATTTVTIVAPPPPPSRVAGVRMWYEFTAGAPTVLRWGTPG